MKKKVVVIGAGPGGLTSAMILAHRGFSVTVYEKASEVGGRNAPLRMGAFTFDTGPTFLMMGFILKEMFKETRRSVEDYLTVTRLDPLYRLKFADKELLPTHDAAEMKRQLEALFPGSGQGYDRFFSAEKKRFEKIFPCLQRPYSSLLHYCDSKFIKALPQLSIGQTMFQKLGDYFDQEELRLSFTFQSKYLGMSAWECPAFFNLIPYVEHAYGIYHVRGGLHAISGAMKRVVEEEGGTVVTGCPVAELLVDGRRIKGIKLANGEEDYADEFVVNADFGYAMSSLARPQNLHKYNMKRLDSLKLSCSTFMIYLGLKKRYNIPHHNIFFARDYRSNVEDIFTRKRLSTDISFYIQNASATDPTVAPEGASTIYILVPVPNNRSGIDWETRKTSFRRHVLDHIRSRTELNDLEDHIDQEKVITPKDWEGDYNVFAGATFNLSHNLGQMLYLRPRNKFEEFENCYLAGGGTHPGSGLPTIYESARISANLLCKKHGVGFESPGELPDKETFSL